MPAIKGSPPFTLSGHDWLKLGKSLLLAVVGTIAGFITATAVPQLQEHVANDWGVILLTLITSLTPVLLNLALKFLGDTTTVVRVALMAATLVLASAGVVSAAEEANGGILDVFKSLSLPQIAVIAFGAYLLLTGKLTLPAILALVKNVFVPAPGPSPTPDTPTVNLIQQLLDLLTKAKAAGDKESETAILKVMGRACEHCQHKE